MQPLPSGRISRRAAVVARAIVLIFALAVYSAAAENKGKAGKAGKRGKNKKGASPTASVSPGEEQQNLTNIPLPIGHEAKGLTLPDFDGQGRLRGKFIAGTAKRLDQDHIAFNDLKITTYTETNEVDMEVEMHTSTFDLTTKILTSDEPTTVRRHDFNVVGDSAVFDSNARTSRLKGNVRMVITSQPDQQNPNQPNQASPTEKTSK
jgi:hypothetical protein